MMWQNRECKIEEGTWMMSAVGEPDNFDFFPKKFNKGSAVAGSLPGDGFIPHREVEKMLPVDEERLIFVATDGTLWLLTGNPADGGRIDQLVTS